MKRAKAKTAQTSPETSTAPKSKPSQLLLAVGLVLLAKEEVLPLLHQAGLTLLIFRLLAGEGIISDSRSALLRLLLRGRLVSRVEDVSGAAAPDVLCAAAGTTDNSAETKQWLAIGVVISGKSGEHIRLDVLKQARLNGVVVLGHVACPAAAGRDNGRLEDGRLQILGLNGRRLGLEVAGTAAAA